MTFKRQTFEDYMREQHAKQYIGTDDDMPDAFDNWDLDVQEVMDYAETYGHLEYLQGQKEGLSQAKDIINN